MTPSVGAAGVVGAWVSVAGSEGVVSVGVASVAVFDGWFEGWLL
jgi:hypothetical protein